MVIEKYHAHIYFSEASKADAEKLRALISEQMPELVIGKWHDQAVGPHTQAMFKVDVPQQNLAELINILILNRAGLSILIHPLSGNDLLDHTDYALWLGEKVSIKEDAFNQ